MTQEVLAQLRKEVRQCNGAIYNVADNGDEKLLRALVIEKRIAEKTINLLKTGYYLLDHELAKKINSAVKETTQPVINIK